MSGTPRYSHAPTLSHPSLPSLSLTLLLIQTCAVIKKVALQLGPITALAVVMHPQGEVLWVAAGQKVATFNSKVYPSIHIVTVFVFEFSSFACLLIFCQTFKLLKEQDAHKDKITCMAVVNNQVWSCSQDTTILVWNSEVTPTLLHWMRLLFTLLSFLLLCRRKE